MTPPEAADELVDNVNDLAPPEAPLAPLEQAVFNTLAKPGTAWMSATRIARRLERGQHEVVHALAVLALRGLVQREVEWQEKQITAVWHYGRGRRRRCTARPGVGG